MTRLPEIDGNQSISREIAPDGALAIDLHRCFDPRDIHQQAEQRRAELYDARRGMLLLGLTGLNRDCRHRWRDDGGIDLELLHPHVRETTFVSVTPGPNGWHASIDGGQPEPLSRVKMALSGLTDPSRPPPVASTRKESRLSRIIGMLGVIILFGGAATWMANDWWHDELRLPKIVDISEDLADDRVDSWLVICPAPIGAHQLAFDGNGHLLASRLAPGPLRPVSGKADHFAGDDLTIILQDRQITLWPDNDPQQAVTCRNTNAPRLDHFRK